MISDYLSKQERLAFWKEGALAYAGVLDAECGPLEKSADGGIAATAKDTASALKSLFALSVLGAGIPIGVFSHVIGRRISGKRLREEELKEKIRLYRDAANNMAAGMGAEAVV